MTPLNFHTNLHVIHEHLHGTSDGDDVVDDEFGKRSQQISSLVKFFNFHVFVHLVVIFLDEHELLYEFPQLCLRTKV